MTSIYFFLLPFIAVGLCGLASLDLSHGLTLAGILPLLDFAIFSLLIDRSIGLDLGLQQLRLNARSQCVDQLVALLVRWLVDEPFAMDLAHYRAQSLAVLVSK